MPKNKMFFLTLQIIHSTPISVAFSQFANFSQLQITEKFPAQNFSFIVFLVGRADYYLPGIKIIWFAINVKRNKIIRVFKILVVHFQMGRGYG